VEKNASDLAEWFAPRSIDSLFIHFCDPWPKTRHAHRRLTHDSFLRLYAGLLKPGGRLHFKTDNGPLFDFSMRGLTRAGYTILNHTRDLRGSSVITEYEEKFMTLGSPVHALEASPP